MVTPEVAWHDARRARIRKNHPSVKELYGFDRRSALAIFSLVALQFAVAFWASRSSVLATILLACTVGPTVSHGLGVLIHEASHNLVTKSPFWNKIWLLVSNLPLGAPAAIEFRTQHLLHHRHLGDVDGSDTQAPTRGEVAWVGAPPWRKILSFSFGRFFYKGRPSHRVAWDGWMVANWATSFAAIVAVFWFLGGQAGGYLVASSLLAFGPHTFGARRLSEHLPVRGEQPTNSYYGPLNWLSFNVGYHVEHHDFPNIPWTRLKRLQALARSEYLPLFAFRSWTRLIVSYFFDARYRVSHYVGLAEPLGEAVVREGGSAIASPSFRKTKDERAIESDLSAAS